MKTIPPTCPEPEPGRKYWRSLDQLAETPEFREQGPAKAPVRQMFKEHWDRLLMCIGIVILSTSSNYIILYMPTYAIKQLHLPQSLGFTATLIGGLLARRCSAICRTTSAVFG